MIREVVMLPEMLEAGVEALEEASGQGRQAQAVACYLAMRAIEEIAMMREASETRH